MDDLKDPATRPALEEGELVAVTLKKLIETRLYRPELPKGHKFSVREGERVKFNKAKFKANEELMTPYFTPLEIHRGPEITSPHLPPDQAAGAPATDIPS